MNDKFNESNFQVFDYAFIHNINFIKVKVFFQFEIVYLVFKVSLNLKFEKKIDQHNILGLLELL